MKPAKFKKGQQVIVQFSTGEPELLTIENVRASMAGMWMYSFEEKSFSCGEMYLRKSLKSKKLSINDCLDDRDHAQTFNTLASMRGVGMISKGYDDVLEYLGIDFFKPDIEFIDWLIKYADDRVIVDIGCGTGHFLKLLRARGAKVMGIEPNLDYMTYIQGCLDRGIEPIQILPMNVEECGNILKGLDSGALLTFARPCHSNFVENGLDIKHRNTEALYITKPENLIEYNDLGKYKEKAIKLNHKGNGSENEVVYSIK